jgi:DNA (cytosine-5)-methyltransferase 1
LPGGHYSKDGIVIEASKEFRVLDLFSGIGGFSLGLERAGMNTIAFCECEPYPCRVLRRHWPTVPIFEDVKTLTARRLKKHGLEPTVICGGFPCQDISYAGKGAGLEGERSGLWREFHRLIREIRPAYAIVENVAALRSRGQDVVLGNLAEIRYDAEWHCIPACAVGAPHRRDRIWIVAYPSGQGGGPKIELGRPFDQPHDRSRIQPFTRTNCPASGWPAEPEICGMADGFPHRLDRLRCLGNAVVPQIPELIGRAIIAHAEARQ